jgi:hypothetical protein
MSMKEDVLRQLLEELLSSADESSPVGQRVSADDLDINKQVIELVMNAGLMILNQRSATGNPVAGVFNSTSRTFGASYALFTCYQNHSEKRA